MDLQDEVLKPNPNPILFCKDKFLRSKYQDYLRKASLLLLSVSILSLFFSFFTGLSFLHSYTCSVSTFLLPVVAHTLERKYLFLLCNGILIFLAHNSGLSGSLPSAGLQTEEIAETDDFLHQKNVNVVEEDINMLQPGSAEPVEPLYEADVEDEVLQTQAEEEDEEEEDDSELQEVLDRVAADLAEDGGGMYEEEFEKENKNENEFVVEGEEDDGVSDGPASNSEELNKKFEEFIRKMKEELKLEAQQQQLIAA